MLELNTFSSLFGRSPWNSLRLLIRQAAVPGVLQLKKVVMSGGCAIRRRVCFYSLLSGCPMDKAHTPSFWRNKYSEVAGTTEFDFWQNVFIRLCGGSV